MKITGTLNDARISFTASMPDESIRELNIGEHEIRAFALRRGDGAGRRRSIAQTSWPAPVMRSLKSIAMTASSSMIRMRALVCASSSSKPRRAAHSLHP
jgi:hypothetical protein